MKSELYEKNYQNPKHFSFGKNWKNFLKSINHERIREAERSLSRFLGDSKGIAGKTFVDIGCGSGLFSLAAYRLGAKKIISIDIDRFSIDCAKYLKKKNNNPENWKIISGSVLDKGFIDSLGKFDIVYSWGVLHHTGNMYEAIKNITNLVNNSGKLYIALYNENRNIFEGTSVFWSKIKKIYNKSSWIGKKFMETIYTTYYIFGLALNGKNPISYIKNYTSLRGMNFLTDIKDWLGGYPYEYAPPEKIISFLGSLNFSCKKTNFARSIGCNEYLFVKKYDI